MSPCGRSRRIDRRSGRAARAPALNFRFRFTPATRRSNTRKARHGMAAAPFLVWCVRGFPVHVSDVPEPPGCAASPRPDPACPPSSRPEQVDSSRGGLGAEVRTRRSRTWADSRPLSQRMDALQRTRGCRRWCLRRDRGHARLELRPSDPSPSKWCPADHPRSRPCRERSLLDRGFFGAGVRWGSAMRCDPETGAPMRRVLSRRMGKLPRQPGGASAPAPLPRVPGRGLPAAAGGRWRGGPEPWRKVPSP